MLWFFSVSGEKMSIKIVFVVACRSNLICFLIIISSPIETRKFAIFFAEFSVMRLQIKSAGKNR